MSEIIRSDVNEEWAHSGIVEAGEFAHKGGKEGLLFQLDAVAYKGNE